MNEEFAELVARYEGSLLAGEAAYFDVMEFAEIAFSYEEVEQYDEALKAVECALRQHPETPELLARRAMYLAFTDKLEEARAQIEEVPNATPFIYKVKGDIYLMLEERALALSMLEKALELEKEDQVTWLEIGDILIDHEEWDELLTLMERAIAKFGEEEELLKELIIAYDGLLRFDDSIRLLNRLLDNNPYDWEGWYNLSRSYMVTGAFEKAIEAIDFAIAIDPANDGGLLMKAYIYYESKRAKEALAIFRQLEPDSPDNLAIILGISDVLVSQMEFEEAFVYLKRAMAIESRIAEVHYLAALCSYHLELLDEAEQYINSAIAVKPFANEAEEVKYLSLKVDILLLKSVPLGSVLPMLERLIALDEPSGTYLNLLAFCYVMLSEHERAVPLLLQSYEKGVNQGASLFRLMIIAYRTIDFTEHAQSMVDIGHRYVDYLRENQNNIAGEFDLTQLSEEFAIDLIDLIKKNYTK